VGEDHAAAEDGDWHSKLLIQLLELHLRRPLASSIPAQMHHLQKPHTPKRGSWQVRLSQRLFTATTRTVRRRFCDSDHAKICGTSRVVGTSEVRALTCYVAGAIHTRRSQAYLIISACVMVRLSCMAIKSEGLTQRRSRHCLGILRQCWFPKCPP